MGSPFWGYSHWRLILKLAGARAANFPRGLRDIEPLCGGKHPRNRWPIFLFGLAAGQPTRFTYLAEIEISSRGP